MMTFMMYWDTTNLPLPKEDGLKIKRKPVGNTIIMADASMKVDMVDPAKKYRRVFEMQWDGLSQTEYDSMSAAFDTYASDSNTLKFSSFDEHSVETVIWTADVLATPGGWDESVWYDDGLTPYYNVKLKFSEVLA